ncbi:hypothetical protein TNIN_245171 [Trichonephila inaurata madagascariensis]|uniref:Uncharacterized protein n=1 Tax=Trichonephila inaurata madagascariensis TaxID=2747483 RepID=A0A8X6XS67_9ARAC|nr:hypothetical protein TNIN_245171 [Trichonephila inaurata madagascariensis]
MCCRSTSPIVMTQKSKFVTPDVVFKILNDDCRRWPRVLPPVSMWVWLWWRTQVQDMRWRQSKTSLKMVALFRENPPVESPPSETPSERPAERPHLIDFLVNEVEVTSRIPTP